MPIGSVDWIADGMLGTQLHDSGHGAVEFEVRNQFFHGSHPLGWIRHIAVGFDGQPASDVHVRLRGQLLPLSLMRATTDIWWQPREVLTIRATPAEPLVPPRPMLQCTFEVSTFFFTPAIDLDDRYPRMRLDLTGEADYLQEVEA